ncbi:hypothetical protein Pla123a_42210 [Posidoniimonas polymericola]|uniref:PEP-CTERM protein-sorting domain-containing protein n=1 Tax=Posidoniimonas polymericola TaxID=2528002 RepID=A0A5C5Y0A6_9BACT|nr:hypothetical protein [Posidoniimonas polymericola]TWT67665.1 hypothetical protein Pla123a_42210 [Posidoniimonas polymericola]
MRAVIAALAILFATMLAASAAASLIHFQSEISLLDIGDGQFFINNERVMGSFVVRDEALTSYEDGSLRFRSQMITEFEIAGESGWWFRANQGLASTTWANTGQQTPSAITPFHQTLEVGTIETGVREISAPWFSNQSGMNIDIDGDGIVDDQPGTGVFGPPPPGSGHQPTPLEILASPPIPATVETTEISAPVVLEPSFKVSLDGLAPGQYGESHEVWATFNLPSSEGESRQMLVLISAVTTTPEPSVVSLLIGACSLALAATTRRRSSS